MDGIVLLREDHKKVETLFKEYEKSRESATTAQKRALVDQICEALTTHAYIEERIFYPAAREAAPATGAHVLESVEEHHVVAWLLSEVRTLDPGDETFDAKVAVLMENVRHHVQEEEQEWFPEVRKALGRNALVELGEEMAKARSDAPADPLALQSARS
ncbi:hemerythrin [Pilimelia terevasa]|uniref:Hemerythrin n=1 Tax=Pilimelia terevasa TaxID=53372 RepID=A0A8J3FFX2_9ACTN|nr:hemerythrin domain-containing protein [Pilimelia terevasa]GGK14625.1 hemerythrin [Pilimelia terevasa]